MLENLRVMNISSQLAKVEQVLNKKEEIINEKTLKAKEVRYQGTCRFYSTFVLALPFQLFLNLKLGEGG
jgi:hypothetical protein